MDNVDVYGVSTMLDVSNEKGQLDKSRRECTEMTPGSEEKPPFRVQVPSPNLMEKDFFLIWPQQANENR